MSWPAPLRSLRNRDVRLFFAGQAVSLVGTWMQSVAQGWLVYRLTHSAQMLGLVTFAGQIPAFLFGVYAGSVADRFPRRRLVLFTQTNAIVQASILAAVTLGGVVRPWHVLVLAAMLGVTAAFESPARQALLADLAGPDLPNAIALNSTIVNGTRLVGPAIAGWMVATVGEGWCFLLNALSFGGTWWALWRMRAPAQAPPVGDRAEHLLEGLRYAARTPHVRTLLALLAVASFAGLPYATLLPVVAGEVLRGGAGLFGALQACAGAGALAGALGLLLRRGPRGLVRRVATGATLLGAGLLVLGLARHPVLAGAALVTTGFGFISQMAGTMTVLQQAAPPALRGRVMGLFSMLFLGMSPLGALVAGAAAHRFGASATLAAQGLVVLAASVGGQLAVARVRAAVMEHEGRAGP